MCFSACKTPHWTGIRIGRVAELGDVWKFKNHDCLYLPNTNIWHSETPNDVIWFVRIIFGKIKSKYLATKLINCKTGFLIPTITNCLLINLYVVCFQTSTSKY